MVTMVGLTATQSEGLQQRGFIKCVFGAFDVLVRKRAAYVASVHKQKSQSVGPNRGPSSGLCQGFSLSISVKTLGRVARFGPGVGFTLQRSVSGRGGACFKQKVHRVSPNCATCPKND
jgi:hypothetical protein